MSMNSQTAHFSITHEKLNLTRVEREALNLLKKDDSIVIKKSDKDSCCHSK